MLIDTIGTRPVSIHAPVWGATVLILMMSVKPRFQSTHPCGVRPRLMRALQGMKAFQSTHPCGVRQIQIAKLADWRVSIHAPVWGATISEKVLRNKVDVSIHAPVWGATSRLDRLASILGFQSTHPCGVRRLIDEVVTGTHQFQSTHPCGVRRD